MKNDKIIEKLTAELTPVARLSPFWVRYSLWLGSVFAVLTALLAITGIRRDLTLMANRGWDWAEVGLLVVLLALSAWGAIRHSVPGDGTRLQKVAPITILAAWIVMTLARVAAAAFEDGATALIPDSHSACADIIAVVSLLIWAGTIVVLRRAAPLDARWIGALSGLASAAAAAVGTQFFCVYEQSAHILAWHVLPVVLIFSAAALAGPLVFQRNSTAKI
jgi:hypothetical protein